MAAVKERLPGTSVTRCERGNVDVDLVLGVDSFSLDRALEVSVLPHCKFYSTALLDCGEHQFHLLPPDVTDCQRLRTCVACCPAACYHATDYVLQTACVKWAPAVGLARWAPRVG